ncbi:hypothetical protein [Agrobacterium tumefaciens]|uniref:hypothetical protein n=1 Tax=Agrobacterium tumefaciens TaxID=358 RepID=UPI00287CFBB1|nr:hypothetical protein [Agrobacterium tumefaciens]MDS7595022.1 hypothetical protein [Agrobacterium tumefaciens]
MLSFSNVQISEKNGVLSLTANLFSSQSNQSYTFRCEVERTGSIKTIDYTSVEQNLANSVKNALPAP